MKICLINPKTDMMISDTVFPPLGLWYVSAALQVAGHEVEIADMAFNDPIPEAEVYGITGTAPQAGRMRNLVQNIRAWHPDALIVAGGAHATLCYEEVWSYGVDMVIRGEAEEVIGAAIEDPACMVMDPTLRVMDLDSLSFPDRRQVDRYQYSIVGIPATMMITSRGCPWRCAFCCKPMGSAVALRSVDNILEEVSIIEDLGYKAINFVDDTLAINRERLFSLADGLGKLGTTWRCFLRAQQASPPLAKAMAEGGCVEVGIGIESGSGRILRNIQKGETIEEIEFGVRNLQDAGIRVKGFFIIGLPGEDKASLAHTEALLERLALDDVDLTILSVYPGSPIYEHPDRYDVQWNGAPGYFKVAPDRYDCTVRTAALTQGDLLEAREYLERRFKRWV